MKVILFVSFITLIICHIVQMYYYAKNNGDDNER